MSPAATDAAPRVFLLDGALLTATRRRVFAGDEDLAAADQRLLQDAAAAATAGPFSVVDKGARPPGGDPHDYLSQAPDGWPDPERPDGLPWVRRDGEVNPDREAHDPESLAGLASAVSTLAAAYFFSDYEGFAERAGLLLRTWFLDPATRMNPHLRYAQGIPGRCDGRGAGTIEAGPFVALFDAVGLLGASSAWTAHDQRDLVAWFAALLAWLVDSEPGREAAAAPNHVGTWCDAQVLAAALFTGNDEVAGRVAARAHLRIDAQVDVDGAQPHELRRARALSYCALNLLGLFDLADLAGHCGAHLWGHAGPGGRSLRRAADWLVASAIDGPWVHPQAGPFDVGRWVPLLRRAALRFDAPAFEARLDRLAGVDVAADRTNLLYPPRRPAL